MDRGAWWAAVHGVAQSRAWCKEVWQTSCHASPPLKGLFNPICKGLHKKRGWKPFQHGWKSVSYSLPPHGLSSPWNSPGQYTGVGSISLLQGIFPTQGSNPGLPHCRQILYQLSWGISNFYWGYTNFICLFTKALFSGVLEIWVSNFFDTLNSPTFGGFWHHFMILSNLEKFRMEKKFPKAVKLGALTYPRWLVKKCQLRE